MTDTLTEPFPALDIPRNIYAIPHAETLPPMIETTAGGFWSVREIAASPLASVLEQRGATRARRIGPVGDIQDALAALLGEIRKDLSEPIRVARSEALAGLSAEYLALRNETDRTPEQAERFALLADYFAPLQAWNKAWSPVREAVTLTLELVQEDRHSALDYGFTLASRFGSRNPFTDPHFRQILAGLLEPGQTMKASEIRNRYKALGRPGDLRPNGSGVGTLSNALRQFSADGRGIYHSKAGDVMRVSSDLYSLAAIAA